MSETGHGDPSDRAPISNILKVWGVINELLPAQEVNREYFWRNPRPGRVDVQPGLAQAFFRPDHTGILRLLRPTKPYVQIAEQRGPIHPIPGIERYSLAIINRLF